MKSLLVKTLPSTHAAEVSYLLINQAARAIALINPTSNVIDELCRDIELQSYSLDWILLTHPPVENSTLPELQTRFECVVASSLAIINQLPNKVAAHCEILETHEILMLGHLELEAVIVGQYINYQIAEHIFIHSVHIANEAMIEKLTKQPTVFSIHLIHVNQNEPKLNHDISPVELKYIVKANID